MGVVLTDNGREFPGLSARTGFGKDSHPYEIQLKVNDIKQRTIRIRRPQTNGFGERFNRTALDEFSRLAFRTKFYETMRTL